MRRPTTILLGLKGLGRLREFENSSKRYRHPALVAFRGVCEASTNRRGAKMRVPSTMAPSRVGSFLTVSMIAVFASCNDRPTSPEEPAATEIGAEGGPVNLPGIASFTFSRGLFSTAQPVEVAKQTDS